MIWGRLRKSTPAEDRDFKKRLEDAGVTATDKLIMVLTAFGVIVVPCVIILILFALLIMWIFGII